VIVAGKGGVGKTTVSAVLGSLAAQQGYRTVLIDLEERDDLGRVFGAKKLQFKPHRVNDHLEVRSLGAHDTAAEYLTDRGLGVLRVAGSLLETVTSLTPGLQPMLQLAKVKQLATADGGRLVIVDAPAAGHALSLLRSPQGLLDGIDAGPIHDQAQQVVDLLADGDRCRVVLVTLPEETPVTETVDTAFSLEEELGIHLGPVIVNGITPVLDDLVLRPKGKHSSAAGRAARLRISRQDHEQRQITRLASELPLATLSLPNLAGDIDSAAIDVLADVLADQMVAA